MSVDKLKLCPVCHLIIKKGDNVCACLECKVTYHRDCWDKTGKCSNSLCPSNKPKVQTNEKKAVQSSIGAAPDIRSYCGNCGALLKIGQEFCPRCGTARTIIGNAEKAATDGMRPLNSESDGDKAEIGSKEEQVPKSVFCGGCGNLLKPGQTFCGKCGRPVKK